MGCFDAFRVFKAVTTAQDEDPKSVPWERRRAAFRFWLPFFFRGAFVASKTMAAQEPKHNSNRRSLDPTLLYITLLYCAQSYATLLCFTLLSTTFVHVDTLFYLTFFIVPSSVLVYCT